MRANPNRLVRGIMVTTALSAALTACGPRSDRDVADPPTTESSADEVDLSAGTKVKEPAATEAVDPQSDASPAQSVGTNPEPGDDAQTTPSTTSPTVTEPAPAADAEPVEESEAPPDTAAAEDALELVDALLAALENDLAGLAGDLAGDAGATAGADDP